MATATLHSLRDRMTPPAARRPAPAKAAAPPAPALRMTEIERILQLATDLFDVGVAALVLARPGGLKVEAVRNATDWSADEAIDAAHRLFEILASSDPGPNGRRAGVMEEVAPGRGFRAATPILSTSGRCLGAICLLDANRLALLSGLQRRLFAEFADLVAPAVGEAGTTAAAATEEASDSALTLLDLADADPDAFALFDAEGRCLLRNARFDALLGTTSPMSSRPAPPEARGCEASWIALRLARDVPPVGVYRAALADGTWLTVEERRGPFGRSLLARVEERDAFGGSGDMQLLFERCPFPMFVFDRDSRAILAVNEAALSLYGWDRDAFLRLDLDGIGPVGEDPAPGVSRGWIHRTRDGQPLAVTGRTIGLDHRGRPAVLVTVTSEPRAADQAA